VHCEAGCDRTGMIVAMLLSLVETPVADVLDDYQFAVRTMNAYYDSLADPGEEPLTSAALDERCAGSRAVLVAFLGSVDIPGFLSANGLSAERLIRLRGRLLVP
jgi:protein-tyrosine phosphatase